VVDPIQFVEQQLFNEVKFQQQSQELVGAHVVKIECEESATLYIVYEAKSLVVQHALIGLLY
jgi:hypothetical protein